MENNKMTKKNIDNTVQNLKARPQSSTKVCKPM